MTYTPASNKATRKYVETKQKRIEIKYKTEIYEERILPAIEKSGLSVASFIKKAVDEKIERDYGKK